MQSLKFLNGTLNTKNQWLNLPTRNISIYNREFVNRVSFGVIVRCPFVISNYNLKKFRKWLRSRQWILCNFSIFAGVFCRYYPQTDIKHQANDFILFLLRFTINFLHDLILFRNFFLFFCPAFADKLTDIQQRKKMVVADRPAWIPFMIAFFPPISAFLRTIPVAFYTRCNLFSDCYLFSRKGSPLRSSRKNKKVRLHK